MTDALHAARLEDLLGYRFRDSLLLERALTHASRPEGHNERLEFLGDAVLDLVAAEELYRRFPDDREGRLTEVKAQIVARRTFERTARRMNLGAFLRIGASLEKRHSLPRSVLGNAFEALIGAVFLDAGPSAGLEAARSVALRWLEPEFEAAGRAGESRASKQILQFHGQRSAGAVPCYRVIERYEHPQTTAFKVVAELAGRTFPAGWGSSKKEAERWAAWEAILVLRSEGRLDEEQHRAG